MSVDTRKRLNFAESSQKLRVELRKADLKLQKELERLEKQSYHATNNISTHQQALKMSWRRMEMKRSQEQSPVFKRRQQQASLDKSKRTLLFSNKTVVTLEKAEDTTGPQQQALQDQEADDLSSSGSLPTLTKDTPTSHSLPPITRPFTRGSPYITSPYTFRREPLPLQNPSTRSLANHTPSPDPSKRRGQHQLLQAASAPRFDTTPTTNESSKTPTIKRVRSDLASHTHSSPLLKKATLPPIEKKDADTRPSTRGGNANPRTMDKATLIKAMQMMKMGESQGPESFEQFYSSSPQNVDINSKVILTLNQEDGDEDEELSDEEELMEKLTKEENSELTLDEMFRQIRHCRYIRHYHPKGTEDSNDDDTLLSPRQPVQPPFLNLTKDPKNDKK